MTPDQFIQLLNLLEKIASKRLVITDAADWPILVVVGGALACVIGLMWRGLSSQITSLTVDIKDNRSKNERGHEALWAEIRQCRKDGGS